MKGTKSPDYLVKMDLTRLGVKDGRRIENLLQQKFGIDLIQSIIDELDKIKEIEGRDINMTYNVLNGSGFKAFHIGFVKKRNKRNE